MIRMKKVLNDLEWTYEKFVDTEFIEGGAFVFRNKESNNVLMVDKAKFVFKDLNIVVHLDNCKQMLANISESNIQRLSVKNPQLATRLNSLLNVSARRREQKRRTRCSGFDEVSLSQVSSCRSEFIVQ